MEPATLRSRFVQTVSAPPPPPPPPPAAAYLTQAVVSLLAANLATALAPTLHGLTVPPSPA